MKTPQEIAAERWFPFLLEAWDRSAVRVAFPIDLLKDHEQQAKRNHDQTLQRLAERGGLSVCELVAVLDDRDYRRMTADEANTRFWQIVFEAYTAPLKAQHATALAAAREEGRREGMEREVLEEVLKRAQAHCTHHYGNPGAGQRLCVGCAAAAIVYHTTRPLSALATPPEPGGYKRLNSREALDAFLDECAPLEGPGMLAVTHEAEFASKPEPAVTCEGCERGLPQTLRLGVLSHYDMDARPQFTRCTK